MIRRRTVLQGGAAVLAGSVAPMGRAATAAARTGVPPDPHGDREPSFTEIRDVSGTNVVFSYGAVVPAFDGWKTHEPGRDYRSLDGEWRFRFGDSDGWEAPDFDDSGWDSIAVPSAWDLRDTPGFGTYDGSRWGEGTAFTDGYAWYRRTVDVPAGWAARHVRLCFLAAGYSATVWLNGTLLGKHEGASTAFALPTKGALRPGRRNVFAVRVYRAASYTNYDGSGTGITDDKALPPGPCDFWPYAGLTRSGWLEAVPQVSIAKLLVNAADGVADLRAVVENHSDHDFRGRVLLNPGAGDLVARYVTVPAGGVDVACAHIAIPGAAPWRPAAPTLHTASATLAGGDTLSTTYGVRKIAVHDAKLWLDDRPLFLKGTNWHEETGAHGRAMTLAEYDTELGDIAAAGANFIRNCVYNRHRYVYDWADEHGMLLLDEWDTMWVHPVQEQLQTETYGLSRAMALTTAWNQHNHPSVIMWGLQNESERDPDGAPIYRAWHADMREALRAVDLSQRPITWASATSEDPAFDLADVVGFNEYFGYFYGESADLGPTLDRVHARYPDKPILITENGSWSIAGQHGSPDEGGTEEWQAGMFSDHWAQVVERASFMAGYTFWLFKDYKTRGNYNFDYNGISTMGMITLDDRYQRLVHKAFHEAPMP